jgi:hypothetical protein
MALNVLASPMLQSFAAYFQFMRAKTKPPGGFVISPEIPTASDSQVMIRTLCGSVREKSVKFPG